MTTDLTCPICGREWSSPRALLACEERCEAEERDERRSLQVRAIDR